MGLCTMLPPRRRVCLRMIRCDKRTLLIVVVIFGILSLYLFSKYLPGLPDSLNGMDSHYQFGIEKVVPGKVPVAVVEEHHEALPYWFHAANAGILPKSGNILVHIDGHSDFGMPSIVRGYPLFRWPDNDFEVRAMMQFNDDFIMAATGTGLFSKLIWVWPKWDSVNHRDTDGEDHMSLGWYMQDVDGVKKKDLCQCLSSGSESNEDVICRAFDRSKSNLTYDGDEIDVSRCHIQKESILADALESVFLKELDNGLLDGGQVVLDIDEDYFGVESSVSVLNDVGISWKTIELINAFLELTFCTTSTLEEAIADSIMADVIKVVIKSCKLQSKCNEDKITKLAGQVVINRRRRGHLKFFCRGEKSTEYMVMSIAKHLVLMTKEQLKHLMSVGFCSTATPKTFNENGLGIEGIFQVCHGFNRPNETAVIFHSPEEEEVKERMNILTNIVHHRNMPRPKVVTVCRSMRDGYTPRRFFHRIESGILDVVKMKLEGCNYKLYYDPDLLGGSQGWPDRHDNWLKRF